MVSISQIRRLASRAGRDLLDVVFPIECVSCGNAGGLICGSCAQDLPALIPPFCPVCATPGDFVRCQPCTEYTRWFDGIRSPYRYAGPVRQAVLALKYGGIKAGASQLGGMLGDYLQENPLPGTIIMSVPMPSNRQRERGYNQADLLATRVARQCDLPYGRAVLTRTRRTEPQAGIADPNRRANNVSGSFAVRDGADVSGKEIILVDDVATTGSTLEECAKTLKHAGARSVWGLVLAVSSGDSRIE